MRRPRAETGAKERIIAKIPVREPWQALAKFYADFFEFSKEYKFDPRETTQKTCSVTWVVTAKTIIGRNEIAILRFMAETHVVVFKDKEGVVMNDLEQSHLGKHCLFTTLRLERVTRRVAHFYFRRACILKTLPT